MEPGRATFTVRYSHSLRLASWYLHVTTPYLGCCLGNPFIIVDLSDHTDPHSVGELEVRLVNETLFWFVILMYDPIR